MKADQIESHVNSKLKKFYYSDDEEVLKVQVWGEPCQTHPHILTQLLHAGVPVLLAGDT